MKGQDKFTRLQVQTIKTLITEKLIAPSDKQKGIRRKIRNIGFHYSDFSPKKDGYTVEDFGALIRSGQIKISDDIYKHTTIAITKNTDKQNPVKKKFPVLKKSSDLNVSLDYLKTNRFEPKTNNDSVIANSSGNYILCLRKNSKLPTVSIKPILTNFEGLPVIYTGMASYSLRTRDYRQHFKGNAGGSTLRKSLGVLFGYKQIPRDSDPNTGKTKFSNADEKKLSEWMQENLIMFFIPTLDFDMIEIELINHFNPPLNLKGNFNVINSEFRRFLSSLRTEKTRYN